MAQFVQFWKERRKQVVKKDLTRILGVCTFESKLCLLWESRSHSRWVRVNLGWYYPSIFAADKNQYQRFEIGVDHKLVFEEEKRIIEPHSIPRIHWLTTTSNRARSRRAKRTWFASRPTRSPSPSCLSVSLQFHSLVVADDWELPGNRPVAAGKSWKELEAMQLFLQIISRLPTIRIAFRSIHYIKM